MRTATQVRGAFKRLGQAVIDGRIEPKKANSAMYAVSGAARCLEVEVAERLARQLETLESRPALTHDVVVVDAEVQQA